jgi:uncharacterized protein YdaU (DUF1376 family)
MHYYKRNIGDYAKKAGRLTMLQHGAYTLLIDACYDREIFPTLEQALEWTWASTQQEIEAVEFVLKKFFTLQDGRYVQTRIVEELQNYHANAETNKRIALEREAKRKEKITSGARSVDEPPPNHKPLTTNHKPVTINQEPVVSKKATVVACPPTVDQQVWSDWLQIRKAKKLPMTETAWSQIQNEFRKCNLSDQQGVEYCCLSNWASFKTAWYEKSLQEQNNGLTKQGQTNQRVLSGLTRGLIQGDSNVRLLGK